MVKVKVYNLEGKEIEELKLDSQIFDVAINPALVHQVIEAQQANARFAWAHTKNKSEVRGGGRKPWRQKGTGRARHGSIRSPLWIGGGVTFGPRKDRSYTQKVNKKMKRKALYMGLTDKVKENCLVIVDKLELPEIKTKKLANILHKLPMKESISTLIVLAQKDDKIIKSANNLPKIKTIFADSLNIFDILQCKFLLIDKTGIKKITEVYKK
ncbi:MAG: 50S ribosomal protein L4 [Candidatus Buchananbacteria bacterium RBG_13_39_9]|uniref:Large ribosomal subunit protein uL4 n=1 Tax=Candidatus Buchananbacteria bacterium RBG_13_39_9 TaxID=1797531 RepID=A0A1G1XNK3_9BACT|nr:MAG: 50S ribosomal protein L4 [Candidatus Buchananbacteria bacterium RBG_13_39_9]